MKYVGETLAFEQVKDTLLLLHGPHSPSDDEWMQYVRALWESVDRGVRNVMVITEGPGPNAMQRGELTSQRNKLAHLRTAVITSSAVARGIVTAVGWLSDRDIRSFSAVNLHQAFAYLKLSDSEGLELRLCIETLRDEFRSDNVQS